jgi:hypothetical protein
MDTPDLPALARLRRLLDAAAEVARATDLVAPLSESTGLSPQGVALALSRCLETDATDADLAALVRNASPAPHVHVILSAGVFTAALRAIAVACATSSSVSVRPSRRDPVFARALVRAAIGVRVTLTEDAEVASIRDGEVHVYGRDETVEAVRGAARPGVRVRAHGAGIGVALVTGDADLEEAARGLADDVVVFDQRGCLSPRVVLIEGPQPRGEQLVALLHARLAELDDAVPRGRLEPEERSQASRYMETMAFAGRVVHGRGHIVGLAPTGSAILVPPPGRHVHVALVRDVEEASRRLHPIARRVVAVGCDSEEVGRAIGGGARVRLSRLGWMQRPPLDGPVDLR